MPHTNFPTTCSLAKLLPAGTVLAFEALAPSFSNDGNCVAANKYLTVFIIISFSLACFFLSFTDSFIKNKKFYYGIATWKGLYIINTTNQCQCHEENEHNTSSLANDHELHLNRFKITKIDYLHAFGSAIVFLAFALSDTGVKECLFPHVGGNEKALIRNLPLAASFVGSILFMMFPATRRGIGYMDMTPTINKTTTEMEKVDTEMGKVDMEMGRAVRWVESDKALVSR